MSPTSKIFAVIVLFTLTLAYSLYEKNKFTEIDKMSAANPILAAIPNFNLTDLYTKEEVNESTLFNGARGALVHFWGTWCAPCEAELPEFLDLAKELNEMGINVLLLAVNDSNPKIEKFLKRFGQLPSNVKVVHDEKGDLLNSFGTVKVPETYLFGASGKNLNKFIGPQDWKLDSYKTRILNYLSKDSAIPKKIDTH